MIYSAPSIPFEATVDFGTTGLAGTIGVQVIDNVGNVVIVRTTAGIIESPAASGLYQTTLTAPAFAGQYSIVWDDADDHWALDDLTVTSDAPITVIGGPGSDLGPNSAWIVGDDVMACCSVETSDGSIFDDVAATSQEILFQLSGRRFPGIAEKTVRPCWTGCGCGWQVLSRGYVVWTDEWMGTGWGGWWCDNSYFCGCEPLSSVTLAGYPVQGITGVLVDGNGVDPATYRLDRRTDLVRVRDPANPDVVLSWPGCQNLDLPDTEPGTWSVTYTYGQNPPSAGIAAAVELACELYKNCSDEPCALPKGTARVTRQGVQVEKDPWVAWTRQEGRIPGQGRGWHTGMASVDMFLNAYNPMGLQRKPTIWSPTGHLRYPLPIAT